MLAQAELHASSSIHDRLRAAPGVKLEVLHPPRRGVLGSDNANSLVLNTVTPAIQEMIDSKGFIENFAHERSYPYLTPLFLYVDRIEFSGDNTTARVFCTVAARLQGEKKEYEVVYIPFTGYRMNALASIANGSYTWRFDRLKNGGKD